MNVDGFVVVDLLSAALALLLMHFFMRVYRVKRENYLLGLPLSFGLLTLSYTSLGASIAYADNLPLSDTLYDLQLVAKTLGYGFLYLSYVFAPSTFKTRRYKLTALSITSSIVLMFLAWLFLMQPFAGFSELAVLDELLRVVNLLIISYIIYYLINVIGRLGAFSILIWAPLTFTVFWVSEYSLFIWGADGSYTAYLGAHAARVIALLLLVKIYYSAGSDG